MEKAKNIAKQVLPWVVTIGILTYLFRKQDYEKIFAVFAEANLRIYIPVAVILLFTTYNLDCISQWLVLNWYCQKTRYRDVLVARGVSFLLMIINFNLGQGGMVFFFYRMTKRSLKRVASAFFMTAFADLYSFISLATIVTVALAINPGLQAGVNNRIFLMISIPACSLAWLYYILAYCYWRFKWNEKFLKSISEWEILSAFKEAKLSHYMLMLVLRMPIFYMINSLYYIAMRSFGANVPLLEFMVKMPIVLFVSGLPISIGGLGPTQLGWNAMFKSYIPEEQGTALSLASLFAINIVNTIIALICLRWGKHHLSIMKQAGKETAAETQASSAESAGQ